MIEEKPFPDDVTSPSKIEALPDIGSENKELDSQGQAFASYMQKQPAGASLGVNNPSTLSPFDLAQVGAKPIGTPDVNTLLNQANLAHNTLEDIHSQLSTPNLKLKSSQKYLIKNKLSDAHSNLQAANAKMGIPPEEMQEDQASSSEKLSGPIAQYLGYVTDSMTQLDSAKQQLKKISKQGANLSPADFMLVQLKMNKAQQELDFTSTLLSKSIEGLKTIMNIQI